MQRKKQFLKHPEYEGGNAAFRKFIKENMMYPEEALKNNVEGNVFLTYQVDDNGNVFNIRVTKGIGYGCDEEAVRLIGLMNFKKVKNRGLRLKVQKNARIIFKISKPPIIAYQYKNKRQPPKENKKQLYPQTTHTYTIKWN